MRVRYTLMDPTKNMTVLVETPLPRERYAQTAAALLRAIPEAEQVGYLEPPSAPESWARLEMMGGEFCGNAAMSTAALLALRRGLAPGETAEVPLEVSGAAGPLRCLIRAEADGCRGTVAMPLPERVAAHRFSLGGGQTLTAPVVELPGICHAVVPAETLGRADAEGLIRAWAAEFAAEAFGVLLYDAAAGRIDPLVLVKPTDTAVWERGCGSGSAALGAWLALKDGRGGAVPVVNPGGTITVRAETAGGRVTALTITGAVRRVSAGEIEVPEGIDG